MTRTLATLALALSIPPLALAQDPEPPKEPEVGYVELLVHDEEGGGIFKARASVDLTDEEREAKRRASETGGFSIESFSTDPDGFVTVPVPAGETRSITVGKYWDTERRTIEIEPLKPGETRELDVELKTQPDLDVTCRLVDVESGEPLKGVEVRVADRQASFNGPARPFDRRSGPEATTDEDGSFTVRMASWRGGQITLAGDGLSPAVVTVLQRGHVKFTDQPIRMKRGATVKGTVRSELGDLPARTTVVFEAPSYSLRVPGDETFSSGSDALFVAELDKEGRYEIHSLPSGVDLDVRVENGRTVLLRESSSRQFAPDSVTTLDLALGLGKSVSGVAKGPDGTPAVGLEVWLQSGHGTGATFLRSYPKPIEKTVTNADGRFVFDDVDPGTWLVGLAPLGYRTELAREEQYAPIGQSIVVEDDDVTVDLVVHRGLFISGRIEGVDASMPLPRVNVSARKGSSWLGNVTVVDGKFDVGPLAPGEWELNTSLFGNSGDARLVAAAEPVTAAPGGDDVVLKLRPGCGMSLRGVDPVSRETVPTIFTVHGMRHGHATRSGGERDETELWNLVPDEYAVGLHTSDGRVGCFTKDLAAGDLVEDVEVELVRGGRIEVTLTGAEKRYVFVDVYRGHELVAIGWASSIEVETIIAPPGELTLRVSNFRGQDEIVADPVTATVTAGETTSVEISASIR